MAAICEAADEEERAAADGALGTGQYFCLSGELCSLKNIR